MSNKVVLGARPDSLPFKVSITMVDGAIGVIPVNYVYRTRTEYGRFIDGLNADRQGEAGVSSLASAENSSEGAVQPPAESPDSAPTLTWEAAHQMGVDRQASVVMQVVKSWELDAPFTHESVSQLMNEQPNAFRAILDGYRETLIEGRLGN